jgi:hypothetical protein
MNCNDGKYRHIVLNSGGYRIRELSIGSLLTAQNPSEGTTTSGPPSIPG